MSIVLARSLFIALLTRSFSHSQAMASVQKTEAEWKAQVFNSFIFQYSLFFTAHYCTSTVQPTMSIVLSLEPNIPLQLSKEEYHVIREKGTERAGSGEYDKQYPTKGYFACRACLAPLYSAGAKFKSGCGWPAFDKCIQGGCLFSLSFVLLMIVFFVIFGWVFNGVVDSKDFACC